MRGKNIKVNMFRVVGDLNPFVQVDYMDKYAEEHSGLMLLDSGSTVNILSRHMADQVSEQCIMKEESVDVLTITNDTVSTDSVRFSFVLGGLQNSERFSICNEYQCEKVGDMPIIGILGNEFMQKNSLVIDYSDYSFHTSEISPITLKCTDCDFFFPMEIGLENYGVPVISIHQDGQDIVTMIDSGSADNILSEIAINKYGVPCQIISKDNWIHGLSGSIKAKEAKVSFNILNSCVDESETIPFEDYFVIFPCSLFNNKETNSKELPSIDGVIGSPFMAREGWILDFGAKIVYKQKEKTSYAKVV